MGMDLSSANETLQVALPTESEDHPTTQKTFFGWAVAGKIPRCLVTGPKKT